MDRDQVVRRGRHQGEGHWHPGGRADQVRPFAEDPLALGGAVVAVRLAPPLARAAGAGAAADRHRPAFHDEGLAADEEGGQEVQKEAMPVGQGVEARRHRLKRDTLGRPER